MNIQKYQAFLKTVEYGSFTKAAQAMGYTQSRISHIISELEREWDVVLLERGRAGVRLTSDGVKLLPFMRRVCEEHERLQTQVDALHGLETGMLRIGTFSSVATHWLPNMIKAFQADYPNIEFELLLGDYTEIERWIAEGRVDCGFLRLPTAGDMDCIPVAADRLLAILPETHPLAGGDDAFPVEALAEYPFMLMEKGAKAEIAAIFEKHNLAPRVMFTTWDDYAIMSMVEKGLGISILPELILQRIPYRITAKELSVPAYREIGIAMRDKDTLSLATRRFLQYIDCRDDPLR